MKRRDSLKKARKEKKLTQQQLADEVGITRAYLTNIENGKNDPSLEVAFKLSTHLGYSLEILFFPQNSHGCNSKA
ncbi:helix-turn-helix transcriptional regulator [Tumebacillus lipolyticus]|uniref:Helix-turn-helix transcriptional regulator n=1 Tax=Tumebacillus lipolyticus TaxID=1280370 RepID=A0ABW4ZVX6_9BACL